MDREGHVLVQVFAENESFAALHSALEKYADRIKRLNDGMPFDEMCVYTDNCCQVRHIIERYFPQALVKVDLFHLQGRITKPIKNKGSPEAKAFVADLRKSFREPDSTGQLTSRSPVKQPTPLNESLIEVEKRHEPFLSKNKLCAKSLHLQRTQHVPRGCVSDHTSPSCNPNAGLTTGTGRGTNSNENYHKQLKAKTKPIGAQSVETASAHQRLFAYRHNCKIDYALGGKPNMKVFRIDLMFDIYNLFQRVVRKPLPNWFPVRPEALHLLDPQYNHECEQFFGDYHSDPAIIDELDGVFRTQILDQVKSECDGKFNFVTDQRVPQLRSESQHMMKKIREFGVSMGCGIKWYPNVDALVTALFSDCTEESNSVPDEIADFMIDNHMVSFSRDALQQQWSVLEDNTKLFQEVLRAAARLYRTVVVVFSPHWDYHMVFAPKSDWCADTGDIVWLVKSRRESWHEIGVFDNEELEVQAGSPQPIVVEDNDEASSPTPARPKPSAVYASGSRPAETTKATQIEKPSSMSAAEELLWVYLIHYYAYVAFLSTEGKKTSVYIQWSKVKTAWDAVANAHCQQQENNDVPVIRQLKNKGVAQNLFNNWKGNKSSPQYAKGEDADLYKAMKKAIDDLAEKEGRLVSPPQVPTKLAALHNLPRITSSTNQTQSPQTTAPAPPASQPAE